MAKKDEELQLWNDWKSTGDKKHFQKLYRGMGGLINTALKKSAYGSNLPQAAFKLEGAQQFYNALETFNPNKGANLATHVYRTVQEKAKRLNYTYQNIARRPERKDLGVYHITQFNNEVEVLKDNLGREPSNAEIADALGQPIKAVETFKTESRQDLSLNAETEHLTAADYGTTDYDELSMHYYDMTPDEQNVFDYVGGFHGRPAILKSSGEPDYNRIGRLTGLPPTKVQKIRKTIANRIGGSR